MSTKTFGLALGGGGVRGLAHALVLEALDDMGCRPGIIVGTSMGAIIGAIYASGVPGRTIREIIERNIISKRDTLRDIIRRRAEILKVVRTVGVEHGRGGIVKPDRFLSLLLGSVHKRAFEELNTPLLVVATDYWSGEEVVLKSGDLMPALKASMAIPGVFAPVRIGDRVLLDGGIVNLVPYEHILGRCDISIAVNVAGVRMPGQSRTPNVWEAVMGALEIMQAATLAEKLKRRSPDVCVQPEIVGVPILAFNKAARVLREAAPAVEEMKTHIRSVLERT